MYLQPFQDKFLTLSVEGLVGGGGGGEYHKQLDLYDLPLQVCNFDHLIV